MHLGESEDEESRISNTMFELLGQLSAEALRRVDLSLEGYREVETREMEAKKAPQARNEGRA